MAEKNPVQNLCDETTCSICLEYFKDPVMIDCGHIFCHACVSKCCEKKGTQPSCPRCREPIRQKNFKPNRQLASIVETAKKFSLRVAKETEDPGKVCEKHQEPLKLFCKDDQDPVCVVCYCSKEHKEHNVIPKDKAFEEYKDKIQSHIELLKKEREEILSSKQSGMTESQNLLEKIKTQRQKITADFKQLHEFLEEQEHRLLAQLKDLDDKVNDHREKHLAKLLEELSSLDNLIKEMEEKWKQPENELLQDIKIILQRCNQKTVVNPAFPPKLKKQIEQLSEMYSLPDVKKYIDALFSGHQEENIQGCSGSGLMPQLEGENNETTNNSSPPQAKLLENIRSVPKHGLRVIDRMLPKGYNRYYFSCLLGAERISSGIHSWELSEGFEEFWAAGVAREGTSLGTIQSHLVFLEQEKNAVLSSKLLGETESQSLLEKTEVQRQKIVAEFKQLHEFLEERERLLLAQLKDLDDEINDHREKHLANLLEKLSSFDQLIKEMEEKQEQPVDEFLQDLANTLQRYPKEKFISPEAFPNDLKERIEKLSEMHHFLNSTIKKFKDTVIEGPPENKVLPPNPPRMPPQDPFHSMSYGQNQSSFWYPSYGCTSGYM